MNTEVKLYKNVPLRSNGGKTINFPSGNKTTQETFFNKYLATTLSSLKWIRQDEAIKLEIAYDDALPINYMMYKNNEGKAFYCFITNRRYINDNVTAFDVKIDVMQTYMFDYELKESYIEREHQARAELWAGNNIRRLFNTNAEGLELGSGMTITNTKDMKKSEDILFKNVQTECAVLICRDFIFEDAGMSNSNKYKVKGILTPFVVYLVHASSSNSEDFNIVKGRTIRKEGEGWTLATQNVALMSAYLTSILSDDRVLAYIPLRNLPFRTQPNYSEDPAYQYDLSRNDTGAELSLVRGDKATGGLPDRYVVRIDSNQEIWLDNTFNTTFLDNEQVFLRTTKTAPHRMSNESKLMLAPFAQHFLMHNYASRKELRREYFDKNENYFGCYYNQIFSSDYAEIVRMDNYSEPNSLFIDTTRVSLPLSNDAYLNYMRNTQASRTAGLLVPIMTTALGIGATALGGGAVGIPLIMGGITSVGGMIATQEAKMQDLRNQPDSIRNAQGNTLLDMSSNFNTILFQRMEVLPDAKKKAYDYMRVYGYKCGEIKTPNINSRYHYNYLKTIGADVRVKDANSVVSDDALNEIANIYDLGVLVWHYRSDASTIEPFSMQYENIEANLVL